MICYRLCFAGVLFALLGMAAPALAQPAEALRHFDEGHQRYLEGDYRGALAAYHAALDSGYASGLLYYNMGNAHYRLDELGLAIGAYEKARRLMPAHRELRHNLEIARARTVDQFAELPTPFWVRWWEGLVARVGAWPLFFAGLAFYLAAAALIGVRIWKGSRGAWHRRALAVTVVAGGVLFAAAFAASHAAAHPDTAVVVAREAALRPAPAADAPADLTVHEGLLLHILARDDGWTQVRLPNGTTGWLRTDAAAEI